MIDYIKGVVDDLNPTTAIVEAGGVGYELTISLGTYTAIQGKEQVKLFVYEAIREDAYQLYGFATKLERQLFLLLISVSGVGGSTARVMLSAFSPSELAEIIRDENISMLKSIKGIGPKAANRIVVELKDKISLDMSVAGDKPVGAGGASMSSAQKEIANEAIVALTMLGFSPAPSQKAVHQIIKATPDIAVEQIIKQALKML